MTDTPTEEAAPPEGSTLPEAAPGSSQDAGGEVEPVGATPPAVATEEPPDDALRTRFLIPLLLPVLAIAAVVLYALNVSRVFLAGDSTSALIIATIITLAILVGGSVISARPGIRTTSLAMMLGFVLIIVVSGGLLALGPSIETHEGGESAQLEQPAGDPVGTLPVEALASIKFNSDTYTAPSGIVEISLSGATNHTLQFRELDYEGFPLGTITGFPKSGKVELEPGEYEIYCTIDGHAAQGMVATITVSEAPPPVS